MMRENEANSVKRSARNSVLAALLIAAVNCWPAANAQDSASAAMTPDLTLVGRIALYPDDLIAIILPASTYPVQIVEAARFLNRHEKDPSLQPDSSWDDTVVALLNYPEVLRMMSQNLSWTSSLGQAVLDSQANVMDAIQTFRDRAYAAGNLRSDEHQTVTRKSDGTIEIQPANPQVVYIPYYQPESAVTYETAPVIHYYADAFPLYYYPYPADYTFSTGFFFGVASAFSIGWHTHSLDYCGPGYYRHPYHGRRYYAPYYVSRDRDDLRVEAGEHIWHSNRRRTDRPERHAVRATYVSPRDGVRRSSYNDVRRTVDQDRLGFAGQRDGTATIIHRTRAALPRTLISRRRSGSDFHSYSSSAGNTPLHQRPTIRRPKTPTFEARPRPDTHMRFVRDRFPREQPPHRSREQVPIRRAPSTYIRTRESVHITTHPTMHRASRAYEQHRGRRILRR